MKTISKLFLSILCAVVLLASCKKADDPAPAANEEEVITDLTLTFTNKANSSEVITMTFSDPDGADGPTSGTTNISGPLSASATYDVTFKVENKSGSDVENVTEEIQEEAAEHQVFFSTTGTLQFQAYTDKDANGNPIGITSTFSTGIASTSTLKVTLKHQPNVKTATSTVADGETDIEVNFTGITIQ